MVKAGKLTNLPDGTFHLKVLGLPDGARIADIRVDGKSVINPDGSFAITGKPLFLTVVVGR